MKSVLFVLSFAVSVASGQPRAHSLVNFSHLDHLIQGIQMDNEAVSIVHIYADYPSYRWTDAGEEGIACVDDIARATIVYLRDYELRGDTSRLSQAKSMLKFVMAMQTEDGEFYNFIKGDHSINKDGKTSIRSFGWWAGRGIWAMCLGYRLTKDIDPAFSQKLDQAIRRSLPHVAQALKYYGQKEIMNGFMTPKWLLYQSGSDATTELMLGLIEFYRATNDSLIEGYIRRLADGLMIMQDGDERSFPYGAHRSWRTMWHSWGNSQSYVLSYAGKVLSDTSMIASAELEARGFYSRLLIEGMLKEWDFSEAPKKTVYEQIAYGIRPMTLGLLRLYEATHNDLYLKMAGLTASWFFGNNVLQSVMYDSSTGRCYDGISDSTHLNRNSGAESTIEALYTLLEIERYPLATRYLRYKKIATSSTPEDLTGTFRSDSGDTVSLVLDLKIGKLYARDLVGKSK